MVRNRAALAVALTLLAGGCGRDWELGIWTPGGTEEAAAETREAVLVGNGTLSQPWDVALHGGFLYVTDVGRDSLFKFDLSPGNFGNLVWTVGNLGNGELQFDHPEGVAVGPDGNVYVADRGNARIQEIAPDGAFVREWGLPQPPDSLGNLVSPAGVATDGAGFVYVADAEKNTVQKFTSQGLFVDEWGSPGAGAGQFSAPADVAVDSARSLVFVVDSGNRRVQSFTTAGVFRSAFGRTGVDNGEFQAPWGVAVEPDGDVIVSDYFLNRVQRFTSAGAFLFGDDTVADTLGALKAPRGLAVSNDDVYIGETEKGRVRKASWIGGALK